MLVPNALNPGLLAASTYHGVGNVTMSDRFSYFQCLICTFLLELVGLLTHIFIVVLRGYRMVNPRLCETARPLFKNPRPNYKSSRLRDCSTCSGPEIPRLLFRMSRFRDWANTFQDASFSHRPSYTPRYGTYSIAHLFESRLTLTQD